MKVVVLDGGVLNPGDLSWKEFEAFGDVVIYDRTPADETVARIGDAEAVYTTKVVLSREVIAACPNLRFIGVLSTGYNVIDVAYAKERGIPVCNIPSYGSQAVAQFAIAMLLEISCHVTHHDQAVHAGRWNDETQWCFWEKPLIELAGKTIGLIGFGRIGQEVGRVAKALGMTVLATGSAPTDEGRTIATYVTQDELFAQSDVVSLHCPLFPETENLICKANIDKMKDGVIILNNSRGGLIMEADLAQALNSGKVFAAAVDVVATEPILPNNPLLTAKNCIITPHISWAPLETRQRLMDVAVSNLKGYVKGDLSNVVNK